jgi:hypothetical protein
MTKAAERCGACAHFRNDAAFLEAAFPGLTSLSSGHASVRGEDGLCLRHDRYLTATSCCAQFTRAPAEPRTAAAVPRLG